MPRHGFERAASFDTAAEAEVVRGLLAASGIDAQVAGTSHLAREQFPMGEVAVVVPAAEVARAREIIASARTLDEPVPAPRPPRRPAAAWKAFLVVGLAALAAGASAILLAPGERGTAETLLIVGALFAALGALNGILEARAHSRK